MSFVLKVDAITSTNLIQQHCCCCSLHYLCEEAVLSASGNEVIYEYLSTVFMCKISITLNIDLAETF